MKRLAVGCLAAVAGLVLLALLLFRWPVEVHRWDQPAAVNYGSYDPYAVRVFEVSPPLWPWPRYEVGVTRADYAWYGHVVPYGFNNYSGEVGYFGRCRVDWADDGVTLVEPTGHRLFIPAKAFVGGR